MTKPLSRFHLSSALTINWSMITCAIHEVAELRLPDDQPVRTIQAVPVLESQHAHLRQRAVVDLDRSLIRGEMLQTHVAFAGVHVVNHGVTLTERRPFDVLPGHANAQTLRGDAGHGHEFGRAPIERAFPVGHLATGFQQLDDLRMRREPVRNGGQLRQQRGHLRAVHARFDFGRFAFATADVKRPKPGDIGLANVIVAFGRVQFGVEFPRCSSAM
ncbi:MAG: hypothetical protein QM811_23290 [Pirellulales bacterium]